MRRIVLLFLTAHLATAQWLRVQTPTLELWTDAGEKNAVHVLDRFAKVRAAVAQGRAPVLPLRVFLFSSEREFREYVDGAATEGLYHGGPERDYILLHTGAGLSRVPAHEYVHLILNHGTARFPRWLDEGMAEFYSTIDVGRRTLLGSAIEPHLRTLQTAKLLNQTELEAAGHSEAYFNERSFAGIFYAESWALVHMLNLAPAWRNGMPAFVEALLSGQPPAQAFPAAFGKSLDDAIRELPGYVLQMRPATVEGPQAQAQDTPKLETIAEPLPTLARADLALHAEKLDLARRLFERAAQEHPGSPEAEAGLGTLAMAEHNPGEARRHLERAVSLHAPGAELYFELAMLGRESGQTAEQVDQLLERAIEVHPNYAEAHLLLGIRWTDSGDLDEAIPHLQKAVEILPRQSYAWHALAYAQMKAGQKEAARLSANRALETADTPEHERMAQALLSAL